MTRRTATGTRSGCAPVRPAVPRAAWWGTPWSRVGRRDLERRERGRVRATDPRPAARARLPRHPLDGEQGTDRPVRGGAARRGALPGRPHGFLRRAAHPLRAGEAGRTTRPRRMERPLRAGEGGRTRARLGEAREGGAASRRGAVPADGATGAALADLADGADRDRGRGVVHYLGGKARVAKSIAAVVLGASEGRGTYVEPFLGGASVFALTAPHFARAVGADAMPDLIYLWQAVAAGWEPPSTVTEQEYAALRDATPSAIRGFVGFGCSYGGKWFGGYARNSRGDDYAGAARRGLLRKAKAMRGARLVCGDYRDAEFDPQDAVVYLDPPYADTTPYDGTEAFDSAALWRTAEQWANGGAVVFVSEYGAPPGWEAVWEATPQRSLALDDKTQRVTERLWALGAS